MSYLDVELEVLVHLVDVGEDVLHDARDDALQHGVPQHPLKHTQSYITHRHTRRLDHNLQQQWPMDSAGTKYSKYRRAISPLLSKL